MSKYPSLTGWFEIGTKPTFVGIYETITYPGSIAGYQYWNGRHWCFYGYSVDDAYDCRRDKSCFQQVKWRGLAEDPNKGG